MGTFMAHRDSGDSLDRLYPHFIGARWNKGDSVQLNHGRFPNKFLIFEPATPETVLFCGRVLCRDALKDPSGIYRVPPPEFLHESRFCTTYPQDREGPRSLEKRMQIRYTTSGSPPSFPSLRLWHGQFELDDHARISGVYLQFSTKLPGPLAHATDTYSNRVEFP
jgi:hypothetical protein